MNLALLNAISGQKRADFQTVRRRGAVLISATVAMNLFSWAITLATFRNTPTLVGVAFVVYALGLRHAVDVDHIAAIDNVTRKLMRSNVRPVSVGFWFAIGHSLIVIVVTIVATSLAARSAHLTAYRGIVGSVAMAFSAIFFVGIAVMNFELVGRIWTCKRRTAKGGLQTQSVDLEFQPKGVLVRFLAPLLRLVRRPAHMLFVGLVFGLGFDTASEVALIGTSASQLSAGVSFAAILLFPLLFTVGMALIDTIDGVLMLRIYDWAILSAERTLTYNLVITFVSAVISSIIAIATASAFLEARFHQLAKVMKILSSVRDYSTPIGVALLVVFILCFAVSRFRRRNEERPGAVVAKILA